MVKTVTVNIQRWGINKVGIPFWKIEPTDPIADLAGLENLRTTYQMELGNRKVVQPITNQR